MAITPRPKDRKLRLSFSVVRAMQRQLGWWRHEAELWGAEFQRAVELVRKLHQERNTLAHRVSQAKLERARESAEPEKYRAALAACVEAMRLWGSEEDGIPADGPIAEAYDRAIQLLDCASAFAAARRGSPFGLDDPTRLAEPFCACGRVVSQCDRSRRNCGKRKATP